MEIIVDVKDNKVDFFMEMLKNLGFVKKVKVNSKETHKAEIVRNLQSAVEEVKLIKAGKKKGVPLNEFLNEL